MTRPRVIPIDAAQAEQPGADTLIDWPLPPLQEAAGELAPLFEGALVTYRDGRRLTGQLMRFSPATGLMEFCPERAAIAHVLAVENPLDPKPLDRIRLQAGAELRENVDRLVRKPNGIFIVCCPTGSGKSTTLHSILGHINKADCEIWTAEDPVEIQQEGLRQVQVNPKAGWTIAAAMRAVLRANPDVIMVGEMRDEETAQIAIEASLTGHTVFSTLHTNNAVDSVVRLLDMGVQPFNFADSLLGVLAQRLVRRLCPACRVAEPLDEARVVALANEYCADTPQQPRAMVAEWEGRYGPLQLWIAPGCDDCRGAGFRGRLGVHELFINVPATAPLIHRRAEARELRALALQGGMRTLKQDGIEKCLQGHTDLNEVRGACG